ncbi:MAG: hypothetical protein SXQ77_01105, partial [Halobacteria archaeon]|nr:hypothetical protein [Halobacteria archaeon]
MSERSTDAKEPEHTRTHSESTSTPTPTLGHVHLKVRNLERSIEFDSRVLGLELNERHDGFAFLTWDTTKRHHDLALQEVGYQNV